MNEPIAIALEETRHGQGMPGVVGTASNFKRPRHGAVRPLE
jgi:hypothetical protein